MWLETMTHWSGSYKEKQKSTIFHALREILMISFERNWKGYSYMKFSSANIPDYDLFSWPNKVFVFKAREKFSLMKRALNEGSVPLTDGLNKNT